MQKINVNGEVGYFITEEQAELYKSCLIIKIANDDNVSRSELESELQKNTIFENKQNSSSVGVDAV
ncbi:MAG: hypothetical protein ACRC1M_06665 [Methanobacteriaceae archaeon]